MGLELDRNLGLFGVDGETEKKGRLCLVVSCPVVRPSQSLKAVSMVKRNVT
jgi:hypothetical protein